MGDRSACSFEGCDRKARTRGLCDGHYGQWSRGKTLSPLRARTPKREPIGWIRALLDAEPTDLCIAWPFYTNEAGYGRITVDGVHYPVHRYVMLLAGLLDPAPGLHVAHSCNNRPCCNLRHLRMATAAENIADKWGHGTMTLAKLDADQVRAIRASTEPTRSLAETYGVNVAAIVRIRNRSRWKHIE